MAQLWRNKEEIRKSVDGVRSFIPLWKKRRPTAPELLTLEAHLMNIEAWLKDIPNGVSLWENLKQYATYRRF